MALYWAGASDAVSAALGLGGRLLGAHALSVAKGARWLEIENHVKDKLCHLARLTKPHP